MGTATYAALEISLRRSEGDTYTVALSFQLSNSATEAELLEGAAPVVHIDPAELLQRSVDPNAYGRYLREALFSDPAISAGFMRARAQAQGNNAPLRVMIRLEAGAAHLHRVAWELLQAPDDPGEEFLATNQQVLLSRYLDSADMTPLVLRPPEQLSALIVIANPADLEKYSLAPIDADEHIARARLGLANVRTRVIAAGNGEQATQAAILAALRDAPTLLYLVCHGTTRKGRFYLWLEQEDGRADPVDSSMFASAIAQLPQRPLIVVLAACDSAGRAGADGSLIALGPRLARAGIPAVLAMQGQVLIGTEQRLMETFFRELMRDGQVDRALAAARVSVRARPDWWLPVLFLRVRSGKIWAQPERWLHTLIARLWPAAGAFAILGGLLLLLYTRLRDAYLLTPDIPSVIGLALATACVGWTLKLRGSSHLRAVLLTAILGTTVVLGGLGLLARQILYPPQISPKRFGIAVARFGEGASFDGTTLALDVTDQVVRGIQESVDLYHASDAVSVVPIGLAHNATEARWRGRQVNADLVVWGQIVDIGKGAVTINFQLLNAAELSAGPRFPTVMLANTDLPFAYLDTSIDASEIKKLVPQQTDLIASFSLGLAAMSSRDYVSAEQYLRRADMIVRALPDADEGADQRRGLVAFNLGRVLHLLGRFEEGDQRLSDILDLLQDDPAVPLSLASSALSQGRETEGAAFAEEAIRRANRWIERRPANSAVSFNRALAYMLLKQYRRAAEDFEALIRAQPDFYTAYLTGATAYMELGETDRAIDLLSQAIELGNATQDNISWAVLALADAHNQRGDFAQADRLYQQAVSLAPDVDWMHYQQARFFQQQGRADLARMAYDRMVAASYDRAWAYAVRAAFLSEQGLIAAAIDDYHEVRRLRPSDALIQVYLASLYLENNQPELAIATFKEALQIQPRLMYGLVTYGNALFNLGDYAGAIEQYTVALDVEPDDSVALYNLGRAYEASGQIDRARAIYLQIVAAPEGSYRQDVRNGAAERLELLDLASVSRTPTSSPTATPTIASTATGTSLPAATPTDTATVIPVATATATATVIPAATPTDTATVIPAVTATATATVILAVTPTDTATVIPAATPTDTATVIPAATPTDTATVIPAATPTDTATVIPAASPTNTATATVTVSPTAPTTAVTDGPLPSITPTDTARPLP